MSWLCGVCCPVVCLHSSYGLKCYSIHEPSVNSMYSRCVCVCVCMCVYVYMCLCVCIDPMHKWRQFKYSFVYIQVNPTSLILGNIHVFS